MNGAFQSIRRSHPAFRGMLALYLLCAVLLAAGHQHRDALQSHDCALCATANTPATLGAPVVHQPVLVAAGELPLLPRDTQAQTEDLGTLQSRAPPLA